MSSDIGRNDPCPCGSGRKYKRCCLRKQKETRAPSRIDNQKRDRPLSRRRLERAQQAMMSALNEIIKAVNRTNDAINNSRYQSTEDQVLNALDLPWAAFDIPELNEILQAAIIYGSAHGSTHKRAPTKATLTQMVTSELTGLALTLWTQLTNAAVQVWSVSPESQIKPYQARPRFGPGQNHWIDFDGLFVPPGMELANLDGIVGSFIEFQGCRTLMVVGVVDEEMSLGLQKAADKIDESSPATFAAQFEWSIYVAFANAYQAQARKIERERYNEPPAFPELAADLAADVMQLMGDDEGPLFSVLEMMTDAIVGDDWSTFDARAYEAYQKLLAGRFDTDFIEELLPFDHIRQNFPPVFFEPDEAMDHIKEDPGALLLIDKTILPDLGLSRHSTIKKYLEAAHTSDTHGDTICRAWLHYAREQIWTLLTTFDDDAGETHLFYKKMSILRHLKGLVSPRFFETPVAELPLKESDRKRLLSCLDDVFDRPDDQWTLQTLPPEDVLIELPGIGKVTKKRLQAAIINWLRQWRWRRAGLNRDDYARLLDGKAHQEITEGLDELNDLFGDA